jgi:hypothetical protein
MEDMTGVAAALNANEHASAEEHMEGSPPTVTDTRTRLFMSPAVNVAALAVSICCMSESESDFFVGCLRRITQIIAEAFALFTSHTTPPTTAEISGIVGSFSSDEDVVEEARRAEKYPASPPLASSL